MEETDLLLAHMDDLARRAAKAGAAFSRFLTPAQQAVVQQAFSRRADVRLRLEGGFQDAERRLAVLLEPQWGTYSPEEAITALALGYRRQDTLGHRDILGALMALGVERATLGDIQVENPAFVVCTAAVGDYLLQNLTQAGRVGLKVEAVPLGSLPARTADVRELRDTVASLRLDALVASAFGLSRGQAAQRIRMGQVELEHMECLDVARPVAPGAAISLRGVGKARLLEVGGQSRKGRMWVTLGRYI